MLKNVLLKSIVAATLLSSSASAIENNFIMDIMPGGFISHNDISNFSNTNGFSSETITGSGSFAPNLALGYGLDLDYFSFDATVGLGVIANGAFSASYTQGEATAYVTTAQKGFMIGPFYRYVNISDPKWTTDNLVMTGTTASAYGISMMTGGKHVKFKMKVSSLNGADIAVYGANGYTPSSNVLSLDGIGVELGLALRF